MKHPLFPIENNFQGRLSFGPVKTFLLRLIGRLGLNTYTQYINGPDTLPPPLSKEEEKKVFEELQVNTEKAREMLIVHNLRLVVYIAKKFESTGIGMEMCLRKNSQLRNEISIDEPLNIDWDGNELLLSDILGTENDSVNKNIEMEAERELLKQCVENLAPREKVIMQMRFGLVNGVEKTQKEVADTIGISQSYISRLEKKIIERLKVDFNRISHS